MEHINKEPQFTDLNNIDKKPKEAVSVTPVETSPSEKQDTKSHKRLSTDEMSHIYSEVEAPTKKPVISKEEEIQNAVKALLGESFDSFDDEAAAAVAGLGISMSPEDQSPDWIQSEEKTQDKSSTEKSTTESIPDKSVKEASKPELTAQAAKSKEDTEKDVEAATPEPITTRGRRGRSNSVRAGARAQPVKIAESEEAPTISSKAEQNESTRGKSRGRMGYSLSRGMPRQEQPASKDIDVFEFQ